MMKSIICFLVLCVISHLAYAECYSKDNLSHECRLSSGDSWCLEHYGYGYAYDTSCMKKHEQQNLHPHTSCNEQKEVIISFYGNPDVNIDDTNEVVKKNLQLCYEKTVDNKVKEATLSAISDIEKLTFLHYKLLGKISSDFAGTMNDTFNSDDSFSSAIKLLSNALINSEQREFLKKEQDKAKEKYTQSVVNAIHIMY